MFLFMNECVFLGVCLDLFGCTFCFHLLFYREYVESHIFVRAEAWQSYCVVGERWFCFEPRVTKYAL
jgi:hypothetical protein